MIHGHPLCGGWEKAGCHGSWLLDKPTFSAQKFSRSGKVVWGCFLSFYLPVRLVRKELLLMSSALLCPSEVPGALHVWRSPSRSQLRVWINQIKRYCTCRVPPPATAAEGVRWHLLGPLSAIGKVQHRTCCLFAMPGVCNSDKTLATMNPDFLGLENFCGP